MIPEGIGELGSEAFKGACAEQIPVYRELVTQLVSRLQRKVSVAASEEIRFDDCDFVEWSEWEIVGRPFAMGVANLDIDASVTITGRMRVG